MKEDKINPTIVKPKHFISGFKKALITYEQKLLDAWDNPSLFTEIVLGHLNDESLLRDVASNLKLEYYAEYWNIDAVFYKSRDKNYSKDTPYAEYLVIALEHENVASGAYEEVYKLSTYNSPLKVLITYPDSKKHQDYLDDYTKILKKSDIFDDFATVRRHLMIFGNKNKDQIEWRYHLWTEKGFIEIAN